MESTGPQHKSSAELFPTRNIIIELANKIVKLNGQCECDESISAEQYILEVVESQHKLLAKLFPARDKIIESHQENLNYLNGLTCLSEFKNS